MLQVERRSINCENDAVDSFVMLLQFPLSAFVVTGLGGRPVTTALINVKLIFLQLTCSVSSSPNANEISTVGKRFQCFPYRIRRMTLRRRGGRLAARQGGAVINLIPFTIIYALSVYCCALALNFYLLSIHPHGGNITESGIIFLGRHNARSGEEGVGRDEQREQAEVYLGEEGRML